MTYEEVKKSLIHVFKRSGMKRIKSSKEMNYTIYIPIQGGVGFEKEIRFTSHAYCINGDYCWL